MAALRRACRGDCAGLPAHVLFVLPVTALLGAISGDSTHPLAVFAFSHGQVGSARPLWMLVCMVVVFVFSFFAGELPAVKQHGGAWAVMFPLLGATWIGQVGWRLMRASGDPSP